MRKGFIMNLCEYLNQYCADGKNVSMDDKDVSLVEHFLIKFGVDIKNEKDLYLFKYNMISAKWTFPIVHECRGIILRYDGKWEYVSRPFGKFFNFQEQGLCKITEKDFSENLQIVEKADGTLISMWYDNKLNKWRISTTGTITTLSYDQQYKPNDTFENLFLKTIQEIDYSLMDKDFTYLFELCTYDNRIVTKYPEDIVYLLAIRNKNTGLFITDQIVDDICTQMKNKGSHIKRPHLQFFFELNFKSFSEVLKWVEDQSENLIYGEYPEGFVIYRSGIPVAKMKNTKYVQAHHVSGGDKGHARNCIIQAIFDGNIDDLYSMLIPDLKNFAESVKEKVAKMELKVIENCNMLKVGNYINQKEYAMAVQKYCSDKKEHDFYYKNKDIILKGESISDNFIQWLRKSYMRFDTIWKTLEE